MNIQRIYNLLRALPPEAPLYFKSIGSDASDTDTLNRAVSRAAHALFDPTFPWLYAKAFVSIRQRPPCEVTEEYIKQAYDRETSEYRNEALEESLIIRHPRCEKAKCLLNALLIIPEPEMTLEKISKITGFSIETIRMYESLFFNVRDRLDDMIYMNEIVYPDTRIVESRPDYFLNEHPGMLMMRAAFNFGPEAVLDIFGTRPRRAELSPEAYVKQIKTHVLATANMVAQAGGANQANMPVMNYALKLMLASEKTNAPKMDSTDYQRGLGALGMDPGQCVLETVKRLVDNTAFNRLQQIQQNGASDSSNN